MKVFLGPLCASFLVAACWAQLLTTGAGGKSSGAQSGSWRFGQDISLSLGSVNQCPSTTSTSCTFSGFLPTTAGSAFVVEIITTNNVTISSLSWSCGGTWTTGFGAHIYDSANQVNGDLAYNLGNTGGCTSLTITLSGAPGSGGPYTPGAFPGILEILPPSGATAAFDQVATSTNSSCSTSCTLPAFTGGKALTATDAVVVFPLDANTITNVTASGTGTYNGYSAPYISDYGGNGSPNGIALNATGSFTGTAENANGSGPQTGYADFMAVAFKSSYGSFTVSPSAIWSAVSMALNNGAGVSCSPTCNFTVGSTAGSKLFVVWVIGQPGQYLSSGTLGASSLTVPSGAGTCQNSLTGVGSVSCGYILSDPSGQTTLALTMSANATYYLGAYEMAKSGGAAALDAQNSSTSSTASNTPAGQALTLSGSDDLVFQAIAIASGVTNQCIQGVTLIAYPYDAWTNCTGQVYGSSTYNGAVGFALNQASAPAPTWSIYDSLTSKSVVAALAFK